MNETKENLNANEQLILKKAKQREKERRDQKIKEFFILIFVIAFFGGGGAYLVSQFVQKHYEDLQYITTLNRTTLEMSQLIDNIRNTYTIHPEEPAHTQEELINMGAIPETLVHGKGKNKYLLNPFGGKIVIMPASPLWNEKSKLGSPTFKMSYQGLPRRACIDLALLDWGDNMKGLIAVALGNIDRRTGEDTALTDIDEKPEKAKKQEEQERQEKQKKKSKNPKDFYRQMRPKNRYKMNVAKPNDQFMSTPFPKSVAESNCFCGRNECSFALHYAVFSVNTPDSAKK